LKGRLLVRRRRLFRVALASAEHQPQVTTETPTTDLALACGAHLRVTAAVDADLVAGIVKALMTC